MNEDDDEEDEINWESDGFTLPVQDAVLTSETFQPIDFETLLDSRNVVEFQAPPPNPEPETENRSISQNTVSLETLNDENITNNSPLHVTFRNYHFTECLSRHKNHLYGGMFRIQQYLRDLSLAKESISGHLLSLVPLTFIINPITSEKDLYSLAHWFSSIFRIRKASHMRKSRSSSSSLSSLEGNIFLHIFQSYFKEEPTRKTSKQPSTSSSSSSFSSFSFPIWLDSSIEYSCLFSLLLELLLPSPPPPPPTPTTTTTTTPTTTTTNNNNTTFPIFPSSSILVEKEKEEKKAKQQINFIQEIIEVDSEKEREEEEEEEEEVGRSRVRLIFLLRPCGLHPVNHPDILSNRKAFLLFEINSSSSTSSSSSSSFISAVGKNKNQEKIHKRTTTTTTRTIQNQKRRRKEGKERIERNKNLENERWRSFFSSPSSSSISSSSDFNGIEKKEETNNKNKKNTEEEEEEEEEEEDDDDDETDDDDEEEDEVEEEEEEEEDGNNQLKEEERRERRFIQKCHQYRLNKHSSSASSSSSLSLSTSSPLSSHQSKRQRERRKDKDNHKENKDKFEKIMFEKVMEMEEMREMELLDSEFDSLPSLIHCWVEVQINRTPPPLPSPPPPQFPTRLPPSSISIPLISLPPPSLSSSSSSYFFSSTSSSSNSLFSSSSFSLSIGENNERFKIGERNERMEVVVVEGTEKEEVEENEENDEERRRCEGEVGVEGEYEYEYEDGEEDRNNQQLEEEEEEEEKLTERKEEKEEKENEEFTKEEEEEEKEKEREDISHRPQDNQDKASSTSTTPSSFSSSPSPSLGLYKWISIDPSLPLPLSSFSLPPRSPLSPSSTCRSSPFLSQTPSRSSTPKRSTSPSSSSFSSSSFSSSSSSSPSPSLFSFQWSTIQKHCLKLITSSPSSPSPSSFPSSSKIIKTTTKSTTKITTQSSSSLSSQSNSIIEGSFPFNFLLNNNNNHNHNKPQQLFTERGFVLGVETLPPATSFSPSSSSSSHSLSLSFSSHYHFSDLTSIYLPSLPLPPLFVSYSSSLSSSNSSSFSSSSSFTLSDVVCMSSLWFHSLIQSFNRYYHPPPSLSYPLPHPLLPLYPFSKTTAKEEDCFLISFSILTQLFQSLSSLISLPSSLLGFKKHPLYRLERDLKLNEMIRPSSTTTPSATTTSTPSTTTTSTPSPPSCSPFAIWKGEKVYLKSDIIVLKTISQWRKGARNQPKHPSSSSSSTKCIPELLINYFSKYMTKSSLSSSSISSSSLSNEIRIVKKEEINNPIRVIERKIHPKYLKYSPHPHPHPSYPQSHSSSSFLYSPYSSFNNNHSSSFSSSSSSSLVTVKWNLYGEWQTEPYSPPRVILFPPPNSSLSLSPSSSSSSLSSSLQMGQEKGVIELMTSESECESEDESNEDEEGHGENVKGKKNHQIQRSSTVSNSNFPLIPVNQYGNVEVLDGDERMVPIGCDYLRPRIMSAADQRVKMTTTQEKQSKITTSMLIHAAKSMNLPFAKSVVGFEKRAKGYPIQFDPSTQGSEYSPIFQGIVVLEQHAEIIKEASENLLFEKKWMIREQMERLIAKKWKLLVQKILIRQDLIERYGDQGTRR